MISFAATFFYLYDNVNNKTSLPSQECHQTVRRQYHSREHGILKHGQSLLFSDISYFEIHEISLLLQCHRHETLPLRVIVSQG